MIRLVNIDDLSPTSPAWEDVLKLEIWEPKDVVLWYLTQNNITKLDDTRKGYEKTYKLVQRGQWIVAEDIGDCCYRCSNCGFIRDAYLLDVGKYCPNCGARMIERDE